MNKVKFDLISKGDSFCFEVDEMVIQYNDATSVKKQYELPEFLEYLFRMMNGGKFKIVNTRDSINSYSTDVFISYKESIFQSELFEQLLEIKRVDKENKMMKLLSSIVDDYKEFCLMIDGSTFKKSYSL